LRHVLPQRDLAMLQASSQGQLLSEADAADPYCVQVRQMAAALQADGVAAAPRPQGLLQRCQTWLQRVGGRTP
jgi:Flp pilus assembly CpaE family ATPase